MSVEPQVRHTVEDLLDEESLAVLAILLAVSLEFGVGFAQVLIRAVRWAVGQTP